MRWWLDSITDSIDMNLRKLQMWRTEELGLLQSMKLQTVGHDSVAQSCLTLCDPMDFSVPGFRDLHYFPVSAQTHVHWVDDAIQLSHPLLPPSSPALNLSQHQGLFK